MVNFKEEIVKILSEKIENLTEDEIRNSIETPPNYEMGDFAFPVFSLAKVYRKNPAVIASEIAGSIESNLFEKVESQSAYINFFLNKKVLSEEVLSEVHDKEEDYGKVDIGKNRNVVVEYSSPNIAKPFHIGHIRTTIIGDSIKRIYDFLGYNTISINHLGDYGTQFGLLIVAIKKWGDLKVIEQDPIPELLKLYVKINAEMEDDPTLLDDSRSAFTALENGDEEAIKLWEWIVEVSLKEFNKVYDMFDIHFDSYAGESFYSDKMPAIVEKLEESGALKDSEGAKIVDLEKYGLPPSLIIKSDGSTIYITRDLAAAKYRHDTYKPYKNIYVVGSQQILHFQQLKGILKEMGYDWADEVVHVAFGMVALEEGTLSTRKGRVVYLEDVLNKAKEKVEEILTQREEEKGIKIENKEELAAQVGIGAVKFQELFNQRIKDYVFSWDKTLSFDGETGPYVQYVHARISSLLEKGNFSLDNKYDPSLLNSEEEINILRTLYRFTDVVVDAHEKYEPYFVTRYTVELAKQFNKYYNTTQVIVDDELLKNTRLMLCYAVKTVIKEGLNLIGVAAPEKM
ncbi:arginyl-tRNA synthetase [Anaerosphaera aminiphila DSM 21120]|uniref:Arginine--tRNA ligase n=1 Tax=Anaerosphaera aminiphila DSM 21120 TaxID=1120995 RepID=A0A1M5T1X5_9FIRM|nr:arginine--tRNA ligase [Anaerosphaera aminiphila]SHH44620.1 arginyl-tRNA synthetase [Anaerosphaera aminiphila DSM 21120]